MKTLAETSQKPLKHAFPFRTVFAVSVIFCSRYVLGRRCSFEGLPSDQESSFSVVVAEMSLVYSGI